jgi:hypothetical protein
VVLPRSSEKKGDMSALLPGKQLLLATSDVAIKGQNCARVRLGQIGEHFLISHPTQAQIENVEDPVPVDSVVRARDCASQPLWEVFVKYKIHTGNRVAKSTAW